MGFHDDICKGDLKIHNESLTFGLSMIFGRIPNGRSTMTGESIKGKYGSLFGGSGSAIPRK